MMECAVYVAIYVAIGCVYEMHTSSLKMLIGFLLKIRDVKYNILP